MPLTAGREVASAVLDRLRRNAWSLLQITVAATVSYTLATLVLEDEAAVFAPVAAVVSLSVTLGQRGRRAVELVGGVVVGLVASAAVSSLIGVGPLRIGAVALLAAGAAVAVGGRTLFVNQAAIAALVIAVSQPAGSARAATRLLDALVGCAVAVAVNLLLAHDPRRTTGRAGRRLFASLREVLEQVATALDTADLPLAERALREARRLEAESARFLDAVDDAETVVRFAPLPRLRDYDAGASRATADRLDLIVGDAAALTRGAANLVRHRQPVADELVAAVKVLAVAIGELVEYLEERRGPERLVEQAVLAAERATASLTATATLASCVLVGQVRSTAIDLLVTGGLTQPEAVAQLEAHAGVASSIRFRRA
jgi:uncharacterized membrane protein YccC